ncbi:sulfur oxidation c-type cytochrome SoxX [Rhodobacterales bacterium 52_120_T64]|nr:sulfur oxidation c-type cytochrome SoxX [Rhodobacterales bacterium 52_120_T64]
MKRTAFLIIGATAAFAAMATAGTIEPDNVEFDDYGAVAASLTGVAGDAASGRKLFANRKLGNCLACHQNDDYLEQSFHGEVGPPLNGVADRWSESELRGIVSNSKVTFEGTIMPSFYRTSGFYRNMEKFEGKPILSAQDVEDVIAYLLTLTE